MQLPQWVLQVPSSIRNHGCGSQSKNHERDPHVLEGHNTAEYKVQPLEHKALSLPSLIWKMKTYLELEGKLGPRPRPQPQTQLQPTWLQPSTSAYPQNNNPMTRKVPAPKTNDKRRVVLSKRRYKVRVIAQPTPTTSTPTAPTPKVVTASGKV